MDMLIEFLAFCPLPRSMVLLFCWDLDHEHGGNRKIMQPIKKRLTETTVSEDKWSVTWLLAGIRIIDIEGIECPCNQSKKTYRDKNIRRQMLC